jgi:L-malate glycosyltransferase
MNIGIVLYPTYGGSGVVATELGKYLASKGHNVHFISYSQPVRLNTFSNNIFYHEVSVSDYPLFTYSPYELALTSMLVDVVKYEKLDLLHVHYAIPHASAAYLAKHILESQGINIPYVTTLHGTDITLVGKSPSFEPVITFAINESDAVTAVSESLKQDTYKYFNVKRDIHVIPNFICLDEYKLSNGQEAKKVYATNGEKVLIHISNFREVKRVTDVVKVFDGVRKQLPAKLIFVGDGPDKSKVERMCRDLNMCDDIKFLGPQKSTTEILSLSDLFVLPSETESFGLAALEAMACGVPVVASNSGGIPEVVEHGVSGLLNNVGDTDTMTSNAIEILSNLDRYKTNARKAAEKFDIHVVIDRYIKLYESLIKN